MIVLYMFSKAVFLNDFNFLINNICFCFFHTFLQTLLKQLLIFYCSVKNFQFVQNFQKCFKNVENVQNVQNVQYVQYVQNVQNFLVAQNSQNVQNAQNVQILINFRPE